MLPSESPFPCRWWGTDLGDARPSDSTYTRYPFDQLPPLPFEMRGDFAWLVKALSHPEHNIVTERSDDVPELLTLLREACERLRVPLPAPFSLFMGTPTLQQRIRSNTDCFLDLCTEPVPSPIGGGHLIRFLADSQGCIFWYLYLTAGGSDHAVVSSPDFYDTEEDEWREEPPDPAQIVFSAESFEAFLCRFWLENEIWFAEAWKTPLPDVGREYIERYRGKQD